MQISITGDPGSVYLDAPNGMSGILMAPVISALRASDWQLVEDRGKCSLLSLEAADKCR